MAKPLKDYAHKAWIEPGNKEDLSSISLSICHGYGNGSVDASIVISDGSDKVYIDCSTYKKQSHSKKVDALIDMLVAFRARLKEFEEAEVDISKEVTPWQP